HIANIGLLWVVYTRALTMHEYKDMTQLSPRAVLTGINEALERQVGDALSTIDISPLKNNMIPYALISSGMIWGDISTSHSDTLPTWSARNALPSALLSAANHRWSEDELDASVAVLGEEARQIYDSRDLRAHSGGFENSIDMLDAEPARLKVLLDYFKPIPEG